MAKRTKQTLGYQIEQRGAQVFVGVTCPNGHMSWGWKLSEETLSRPLICTVTSCNAQWTQAIPQIMHLEAEP